jgi:excisionase family DNA binding protein
MPMTLDTLLANAPAHLARWHEVHAYLARHLPQEEGRYDLGDEWIEYLIVNDEYPEVVILDQSNEDIDLWDVYEDLCRPAPAAMPDHQSSAISTELDELKKRVADLESKLRVITAQPDALLTADEAAAYLKTTTKQVYHLVHRRRLRKLAGSTRLRFTREQLDAYLEGK